MGLIVGRYKVVKNLGRGGMGEVFLAHDALLDRKVAIKVLSQELTQKKEFLHRFVREARITASLDHPNIVKIFDLIQTNNQYYLIMEYIDGQSLRSYLEEGLNKDINSSLDIFLQILDGVEYAHNKGIVHRDLKPENIMLTRDKIVKITDFGIAFALGSHSITNPGVLMGTLAYLSPEQAKGIDVDQQTDIYSLGVILYELLTSNLPIIDTNPASMIYKILNESPMPPTKYNPNIPEQIEKIILKCLQKDKKLRYKKIEEIKKDFELYFTGSKESKKVIELDKQTEYKEIKSTEKESINEVIQKTIGDILSEISAYKKNIQDIFYQQDRVIETQFEKYPQSYVKPRENESISLEYQLKSIGPKEHEKKPFTTRDIEIYLSKAQKEYENRNYEETIKILELILPYYQSKTVLYVLAKSYYKINDLSKALYYIQIHKREYGENEKILSLEGDIFYFLRDYPNSYISYYKAYELTGDKHYLLLASRAAINYQPDIVINHLSSIIPFENDKHILAKSYKYLGLAYYKMGNYELAIENLENYLKNYSDKEVLSPLIKSYKMAGKTLELAKIYSSLLEATDNPEILKEALAFYISTNKYKEAIEICYRLISLNPEELGVYQDLYLASKSINNTPSLILAIENILRLHNELSIEAKIELMEELVNLYQEEQQYWDAINTLNDLINISGNKVEYKYLLADLLSKVGRYEAALNLMYELISFDSSNAMFYEKLAEIYQKSGQIEQAIQSIKTALSLDPSNYHYYKILSNLYLELNKTQELIEILKNLIDFNPQELEAYILLAQVYLLLKNYQEAYENILIAYSKAHVTGTKIPLKAFDILLNSMYGMFKETELINKFKELVFEIKDPRYMPYLYFSIAFFYWLNGYEINTLEYLNNLMIISKNLSEHFYILANAMVSFIKGKKKEAILFLEENQKIFKESSEKQIKKKYYEILISFYLLTNTYAENLENYFNLLDESSEKYDWYPAVLKGMFIERLAKTRADYLNALYLYEKVIKEGPRNQYIIFRAFLLNYALDNLQRAREYMKELISINPTDEIYIYYYKKINEENARGRE